MTDKLMPIMGTGLFVRFSVLDEEAAQRNHGQTLARLAERGGLDPTEALAVAERRAWRRATASDAMVALAALVESAEIKRLSAALSVALAQLEEERARNAALAAWWPDDDQVIAMWIGLSRRWPSLGGEDFAEICASMKRAFQAMRKDAPPLAIIPGENHER